MLKTLSIRNYALISQLEIDFPQGFSVITGETGAGKSIILGALNLILGQRADSKSIQGEENKCFIEGIFDISNYRLEPFFQEKDMEYDPNQCILRREIWKSGKSRVFINDSPATLNDMKDLAAFLIDIHSQHENPLLADNRFQLKVLDILAGNSSLKKEYKSAYGELRSLKTELKDLQEEFSKKGQEEDYLRFQYRQLEEARLREGELSELEEESRLLSHVEEIKSGLFRIENLLSSDHQNIVSGLKEALNQAQSISGLYPKANEYTERLESAYIDCKELVMEISSEQDRLELSPERLQEVRERLDLIYSLQQKHRLHSIEELIDLRNKLEKEIHAIDHSDEIVRKLEEQVSQKEEELLSLAKRLNTSRKKSAQTLEPELIKKVRELGMPDLQFKVDILPKIQMDSTGIDNVVFLFSANKHGKLNPVSETASGGEISRLMLGLKSLIAGETALPTIIFDEIDTGVSGETADKLGTILHEMGKVMQVISITHLPQIAARGDSQFFVFKEDKGNKTETSIRLLNKEERVTEIAHLLSGSEVTKASLENARELLKAKTG